MKQEYTLTAYTEDQMGLLNKITVILSRRKISLESLNISTCEIDKMYRCTLVINDTFEVVRNIALQIEKIIEVFKCYYSTNDEIVWKQIALFKIKTSSIMNEEMNYLLRKYNTQFITIEKDFTVFEATGHENEIKNLALELKKFELIEFVKSGRIAVAFNNEGFEV
ncbi:acetolactate synthase small subunit [Flavobacterium sp. WLB]|uniref:acetolactate synthase small subunit n=1 Tax=unclassified Flavobacterium TaxID=196869 RepID=UPI0006ABD692|nr:MULTISPECIES: acetolactate synthase small subunit [unclassified Flavobacterium]KOP39877.1 acetohydroxyacid synthase small subunit [Flavobacterium sp. VMW]OWU92674.1 acetohydroxyacid synthase small subunit [Flavobacterium sp. NLM]PUU71190.1 acetolactate synthase small subunit [Flavobacterium sp. WLB]